jgi:hypothetical protein
MKAKILVLLIALLPAWAFAAEQTYATPEEAVAALVAAVKAHDKKQIQAVLGTSDQSIESGDPVADKAAGERFAASFAEKHALVTDGDAVKLTLGNDDFPFAFPLVKKGDRWRFDTMAGRNELLARRIGQNELYAINVLQAVADAQRDYASEDRDGDGVVAYARKFMSSPGKRDGLYWPTKAGEPASPLGPLIVQAAAEGYKASKSGPTAYHGYYYRMLKGQAKTADTPAFDYVVHGRAIGGFGVIAYPAKYGSSGIMSFMINQDGKVFEADLGPKTAERAGAMQRFDPGKGWSAVPTK